jgi:hypothetical protein
MRPWPPFPKTVNLDAALEPLLRVINTCDPGRYDGFDVGDALKCECSPPDEYLRNARGDGLDSLRGRTLVVAFQLGIEQGRRLRPTTAREGMRPGDYLLLAMSAGRCYLEATGWTAREWERDAAGYITGPVERAWTPPGGGEPVDYLEALRVGAFDQIGRSR